MSTIQLTAPDGPIDAWLEKPDGPGPWPGVVVLHDISGVGADIRRITRRIADQGYLAIAPNLFARGRIRCIPGVVRDLMTNREGPAIRDILAARSLLEADPDCTGKTAVVGFCLGGGFALLVAPRGFDAAAPFYPSGRGNYADVLRGSCPVVATYAKLDPINVGRANHLEQVLAEYGVDHDIKVYPGVTHAFANELPGDALIRVTGLGYNEMAAGDAWRRIFAFFDKYLSPGTPGD
ncbi:dienelactone hydrolase family protein [Nocardia huaxiensis]|uniref:Dienelactone hydrolase family protein n=1 Tax=Nocardia huaxiensis TaxID=2755382 RepID=A0A7D6ZWV7_9NOCA|nr:dienelactone hydrolase family protein [Nocardia huaxiensis]QLY30549.1 dienelactone hydrolase family protein [Nocardia huaxiensis]UFS95850.1 dienelactone hydrolase family protein [Nocardia huaxiensis]